MKISYITTINHNVGDDFIQHGITHLLERKAHSIRASLIHKHIPLTARHSWEWFFDIGLTRMLDKLPRGRGFFWSNLIDSLPIKQKTDKILCCDLLVQCGAPVYWNGAQNNEWYKPLVKRRYLSVKEKVPFINLGAGTCLPYNSDGSEILVESACIEYIKELHSLCCVTTVRDTLSKIILNRIGLDAPVIPCPSLFARNHFNISPRPPEYIALNFMPQGGHFHLGQEIDGKRWEMTFNELYAALSREFPVVLFCHDRKEYLAAGRILPEAKRFIATSAKEYLDAYSRAKYFIGNRVHAAFAVASFGRPAFVVGSDTRALMMKEIGLKCLFVNEANIDVLMNISRELEKQQVDYSEEFEKIKIKTFNEYSRVLEPIIQS